jgi:hypothetical protein
MDVIVTNTLRKEIDLNWQRVLLNGRRPSFRVIRDGKTDKEALYFFTHYTSRRYFELRTRHETVGLSILEEGEMIGIHGRTYDEAVNRIQLRG